MKRIIILLMTFVFTLSFNTFVFAKDDSWGNPSICEVAGDILVIRPLGLVRIGIEAVAYGSLFRSLSLLKRSKELRNS